MLEIARGYDFNYVLNGTGFRKVATAKGEKSGIKMSVFTDRPCMQFYTGNFLGGLKGKKFTAINRRFVWKRKVIPMRATCPLSRV